MKKLLSLILVAVMIFCMAACGSKNTDEPVTENPGGQPVTETKPGTQQAITTEVESKGGSGRTDLNIPLGSIGNTLDAHALSLTVDYSVVNNVYDGLFRVNDDTSLDPRVAESYTVSDDGLVFTYNIRKGIKFHNGDELTANDVVYSFTRCMENSYQVAGCAGITKVEAADDYTVKFTLEAPNAVFPISSSKVNIVNKNVIEAQGDAYGSNTVDAGCGAYIIDSYDQNTKIVLKAVPDYYLGKAPIETINFVPMLDSSTQLISFQSGQFDFCPIPAADWDTIVATGKFNTSQAPSKHCSYITLNSSKKDSPLYNMKVRQAIAWALDKESMCIIAADGFADAGTSMVRPGFFDGSVEHAGFYDYDIEKAKALLAEAGYPNGGFTIELQPVNGANNRYIKIAEVIKENLSELGIECTIVPGEAAAYLASWKEEHNYDVSIAGMTWNYSYNDFASWINGSNGAYVPYSLSDGIDLDFINKHLEDGLAENNLEARRAIYSELDEYILETATYIPIMYIQNLYAWDGDLNGTAPLGSYYFYNWSWK